MINIRKSFTKLAGECIWEKENIDKIVTAEDRMIDYAAAEDKRINAFRECREKLSQPDFVATMERYNQNSNIALASVKSAYDQVVELGREKGVNIPDISDNTSFRPACLDFANAARGQTIGELNLDKESLEQGIRTSAHIYLDEKQWQESYNALAEYYQVGEPNADGSINVNEEEFYEPRESLRRHGKLLWRRTFARDKRDQQGCKRRPEDSGSEVARTLRQYTGRGLPFGTLLPFTCPSSKQPALDSDIFFSVATNFIKENVMRKLHQMLKKITAAFLAAAMAVPSSAMMAVSAQTVKAVTIESFSEIPDKDSEARNPKTGMDGLTAFNDRSLKTVADAVKESVPTLSATARDSDGDTSSETVVVNRWECESWDENKAGDYIFTPVFDESVSVADNVSLPELTVSIDSVTIDISDNDFDDLVYSVKDAPTLDNIVSSVCGGKLTATSGTDTQEIAVDSWDDTGYSEDQMSGFDGIDLPKEYTLTPVITEYTVDEGSSVPSISVTISESGKKTRTAAKAKAKAKSLPSTEQSLNDIIEKDSNGNEQIYVTIYDSQGRVIDTTDPNFTQDNHYKAKSDGGEGGELTLNDAIDVRLRVAGIIPASEDGIKENVTYVTDVLPSQLVPEDEYEGKTLVNPAEPFAFARIVGDIDMYGGLYTNAANGYQFKMYFENAEDQVNISGAFQYGSTINKELVKEGDTVSLNFGKAGTVGFKIKDAEVVPETKHDAYTISLSGGRTNTAEPAYYWETTINKTEYAETTSFPYHELTITNNSGLAYVINEANQTIFNAYGRADNDDQLWLDLTYADGHNTRIIASKDDIQTTEMGTTTIRFKDTYDSFVADLTFTYDEGLLSKSKDIVDGKASYMTDTAVLSISDGNDGDAPDIKELKLHIPSAACDTWRGYDVDSTGTASVKVDPEESSEIDMRAASGITDAQDLTDIYMNNDDYQSQELKVGGIRLFDNLVQANVTQMSDCATITFDMDNTSNDEVKIYASVKSLLTSKQNNDSTPYLVDPDHDRSDIKATFTKFRYKDSKTEIDEWEYYGHAHSGPAAGGVALSNSSQEHFYYSYGTDIIGDAEFQYKFLSIAERNSYYRDGEYVIYRSKTTASNGKYIYVMVDPVTNYNAKECLQVKRYILTDRRYGDSYLNPGEIKLYVFNAASNSSLDIDFPISVGAVDNMWGDNKPTNGTVSGDYEIEGYAGKYYHSCRSCTHLDYNIDRAAYLEGQFVDTDKIFWIMTVDTKNISGSQKPYKIDDIYLYATGENVHFVDISSCFNVDGNYVYSTYPVFDFFARSNETKWTTYGNSIHLGAAGLGDINDNTGYPSIYTTGESNASAWYQLDIPPIINGIAYADNHVIRIGFITYIDSDAKTPDKFSCTAQLVFRCKDFSDMRDDSDTSTGSGTYTYAARIGTVGEVNNPTVDKSVVVGKNPGSGSGSEYSYGDVNCGGKRTEWTLFTRIGKCISPPYMSSENLRQNYISNIKAGLNGYSGDLVIADKMTTEPYQPADSLQHTYVTAPLSNVITVLEPTEAGYSYSGFNIFPIPDVYGTKSTSVGYGAWEKYTNGNGSIWTRITEDNYETYGWNPKEFGIYRCTLNSSLPNSGDSPLQIYIYYSGNMKTNVYNIDTMDTVGPLVQKQETLNILRNNSFVIQIKNAKNLTTNEQMSDSSYVLRWKYTTEVDPAEVIAEYVKNTNKNPNDVCIRITAKNTASIGSWYGEPDNSQNQASYSEIVTAYLGIDKKVTTSKGIGTPGNKAQYSINVTTGTSGTEAPSVNIEDYITGFSNIAADGELLEGESQYNVADNADVIKALVSHLNVSNFEIKQTDTGGKQTTICSNGAFAEGWSKSTLTPRTEEGYSSTDHPGNSLFKINLVPDSGTIPNGTTFTVSYSMEIDTDGTLDSDGKTFRNSDYYAGEYVKIEAAADATRTLTASQNLTVDSGAVATGTMLNNGLVYKTRNTQDDGGAGHWTANVYTGSIGKEDISVKTLMEDSVTWDVKSLEYTAEDGTKVTTAPKGVITLMEHLIEKHTKYSNVKIYLTDGGDEYRKVTDDDLLYDVGDKVFTINGNEITGTGATKDGLSTVNVGETPEAEIINTEVTVKNRLGQDQKVTLTLKNQPSIFKKAEGDGVTTCSHECGGLILEATGIEYNKTITMAYDMAVDWNAVQKEAADILGDYKVSCIIKNWVIDGHEHSKAQSGNRVQIEAATISKSVTASKSDGSAEWTVGVNTGSMNSNKLIIKDAMAVGIKDGTDSKIKTAAEKATTIDPDSIKITLEGKPVYENGAVTGAGWIEDNISISIKGLAFEITIKDTDDSTVLAKNQSYVVTYSTKLDKNAYVKNGGTADGEYTLTNTATVDDGSFELSADTEAHFKPDISIKTSKKFNKSDSNLATWTVTAKTGEVARTNFTLLDQIAGDDETIKSALSFESMTIDVATGEEADEAYTVQTYSSDELPQGVKLTAADGSKFTLNSIGTSGFKLIYDTIPAHTTVTVTYTVRLDKNTYLKAGGEEDKNVTLKNTFTALSDDGSTSTSSADGRAYVGKAFKKEGDVTSTATETDDGLPIITWTFNADLTQEYTAEELGKLTEISLSDSLSPVLSLVNGTTTVTDVKGNDIPFELETVGRLLTLTVKNPSEHPNITWTFKTKCIASIDSLVNEGTIKIDGKTKSSVVSEDVGEVKSNGQSGIVQSYTRPSYTPTAVKYVDSKLCTTADMYNFTLTAVDENGNALTGSSAYTETVKNAADGSVTFSKIKYSTYPKDGETNSYYYEIKEIGPAPEDTYTYKVLDNSKFIVRVNVTKVANGYLVTDEIVSHENYDTVSFNNTTKIKVKDFKVTKTWSDQDNKYKTRPSQIIVHLYQGGKPYNNMSVTLNEDNNWSYTWKDLPLIGGDYSVAEDDVAGYTGSVKYNNKNTEAAITNTLNTTNYSVEKAWDDNDNANKVRPSSLTVSLLKDGKAYRDITATLSAGNKWKYTWKDLPAGTYSVKEEEVPEYRLSKQEKTGGSTKLTNRITTTKLAVEKYDSDQKTKLGGAEFRLYTENGDAVNYTTVDGKASNLIVIGSNGTSGELKSSLFTAGKYYLVETKAPAGHTISGENLAFEIKEDDLGKTITIKAYDDKLITMPSTGGEGRRTVYMISAGLGIAFALLVIAKKKRRTS